MSKDKKTEEPERYKIKFKIGRPPKTYTIDFMEEVKVNMVEYIKNVTVPLICEFALTQGLYKQWFDDDSGYMDEEFLVLKKLLKTKTEAAFIRGAMSKQIDKGFSIFMLKNHGYSDNQVIEHKGGEDAININAKVNTDSIDMEKAIKLLQPEDQKTMILLLSKISEGKKNSGTS